MSLIRDEDKVELKKMFDKEMVRPVKVIYFSSDKDAYKKQIDELLTDLTKLSDKIIYEKLVFDENKELAKKYGVEHAPCIAIAPDLGYRMRFYGIPSGYEFISLIDDIKNCSKGANDLSEETKKKLKEIDKELKIIVFVTPTCPYCPRAVSMAHKFSMENELIDASMIEAMEYREWAMKYNVMAVPKIVINDKVEFEGALPEENFLNYILEAARK